MSDDLDRIELSPEAMRSLGYRVVDLLVDHLTGLRDRPVVGRAARSELEEALREPPPEEGIDPEDVLRQVERDVLGPITAVDHPRFFAYVPGPGNFVGAMADALAAGFNVFAGAWFVASGPAQVELVTVDWLRALCGLPDSAGGAFVSGGSMANLTALAVARHARLGESFADAVVYCSDQTHSSVERGLRTLGFSPDQLRKLPSDDRFRLSLDRLRDAIAADRTAGLRPFCVVANAGTTNTGAVDPLQELAEFVRSEDLWLHVDGAYGAAAAITPEGRSLLRGIESADSLSLDPHKWFFQPFECGCVLLREAARLKETFRLVPEYLKDSDLTTEEVNFRDHGVQLTRSFRALKLWMSLKTFGVGAYRRAIQRGVSLAELAESLLRASSRWNVVTRAQLGIVTFRYVAGEAPADEGDRLNREIAGELAEGGYALLSTTVLDGRTVLRLCTINPRTTGDDIRGTVERLESIGDRLVRNLASNGKRSPESPSHTTTSPKNGAERYE